MRKLAYILLMILLVAANAAAQESYVIDIVCQDAERTYRIDGEEGSTWLWKLLDADSTQIALANETGTDFSGTDSFGNPIRGSEIIIPWTVDTGMYYLSVEQTSTFGCINHELGEVEVVPVPEAFAGNPIVACATDNIFLEEATAANYSELIWVTFGDGTFSNPNAMRPTYFPGEGDLASGNVTLSLTAMGLGKAGTCQPAVSTIDITFIEIFAEISPFFAEVCEGTAIQLNGNPSDNSEFNFTHVWSGQDQETDWLNATDIVDPVFSENAPTGVYVLTYTVTNEYGCRATDRVVITVNKKPLLVITDPEPVCEPEAIDLTAAAVTAGSDTDIQLSFWLDEEATQPLTNPDSVTITGTYYIRAVNSFGCFVIEPVNVIRNSMPILVITDPDPVCEPETIDLTDAAITTGSDTDIMLTYWLDEDAAQPLTKPDSVATGGIYFIRAENPGGCFVVEEVNVIIYNEPVLVITNPDPVCEPDAVDLTRAAITAGSDSDLQFSYWLDEGATQPLTRPDSVALAGSYYIGATNTHGCFVIEEVDVIIYPRPVLVITDPEPVCEPNAIDLTDSNVTAGSDADILLTYWLDEDATQSLSRPDSVTTIGTYYIRAENTFGCFTVEAVNAIIDSQPLLVITDPAPVCEPEAVNLTDASITAGSDSDIHLTYWLDEEATLPLSRPDSVTATGTYFIMGTNLGGCFITKEVNVTIHPKPLLVITDPEPVCEPESINLTDVAVTAGSDADLQFTYWLDEAATQPLNNPHTVSETGVYYIRAENSFGCFAIEPVNVTIYSKPVLVITDPDPVCEPGTIDLTDPSVTAGSDDDIILTYWLNEGATLPLNNPGAVAVTGIYYLRAENAGGCFEVKDVSVIIDERPLLVITNPEPVCEPETIDLTAADVTAGSDFGIQLTYWLDAEATQPLDNPDEVTESGTYYIGATNLGGCVTIEAVNVTIHRKPLLVITDPEPVCEPEIVDLTVASVTAGSDANIQLTYWLDEAATQPLTSPNAVAETGTYYIRAENSFGCFTIEPVNAIRDNEPILVITDPAPVCEPSVIDLTDPSVTLGSDSDLQFTYWIDEAATQLLNDPDAVAATGTYYIRAENAGGCFVVEEVNVILYDEPVLVITDPAPVCEPETIDLTETFITAGSDSDLQFTYWLDGEATLALDNPDSVTESGTYYIGATNAVGCFVIKEANVTIYSKPLLAITDPDPICEPGYIDLTDPLVTAGSDSGISLTYWLNDEATQPLSRPDSVTVTGIFYIRAENSFGCFTIEEVSAIIDSQPLLVVTDPDPVCEPEAIDLTDVSITAGSDADIQLTYWLDGEATQPLARPDSVTASGTYYIRGTNLGGCFIIETVNVTIHNQPLLVITDPDPVCAPFTVDLTAASVTAGSDAGLQFTYWLDSQAIMALNNPTSVEITGVYFIRAENAFGCLAIEQVNVVIGVGFFELVFETACDSFTWLEGTGETYYTSGIYDLITPNAAGCDDTLRLDLTIIETVEVSVLIAADRTEVAEGEAVIFAATPVNGGTNPEFAWFVNGVQVPGENAETFTYIPEDEDVVYATLLSDLVCSGPKPAESNRIQITVTEEPGVLVISHFIIPIDCYGESTGGIELTVSGGTEPYAYLWNTGATTEDIYDLAAGTYTVTVTDDAGESKTHTVILSQPTEMNLTYTKVDLGFSTEPVGSINLTVSGGTGPYTYLWTGPERFTSTSRNISNLPAGAYIVEVTDANGCQISRVIIIEAESPNITQVCPPDLFFECVGDETPIYRNYQEFADVGGLFESDCGLVLGTFRGEQISRIGSCPTIITRRYRIVDECGTEMECYQTITIDDNTPPRFPINPYPIVVECIDDVPPQLPNGRQGYNRFVARYGPATDNCGIDESTFILVSETITNEECPKTLTVRRQYRIRDLCGNLSAPFLERIEVEDKTPPQITCPPDVTAEAPLSELETLTGLPYSEEVQDIPLSRARTLGVSYSDNCAAVSLTYFDVADGDCPITIQRTFTVSDGCNETSCIQTIVLDYEVVPVFAQLGPLCQYSKAPELLTTSENGITGTWIPATINTSVTGTAICTFTPDAGQCAVEVTMEIEIVDEIVPDFDPIGPLCLNDTPPLLPNESTNGITGTWEPAVVSTATVGIIGYTFTPDEGQCAVPVVIPIEVGDEIEPVFSQLGPFCLNSTPPELPLSSDNNITGTWEPAVIETGTTETGYYTFTPDSGQCAVAVTIEIEIADEIVPVFNLVDVLCLNETPPVLPLLSLNNITGTWVPDTIDTSVPGSKLYTFIPGEGECAVEVSFVIEILDSIVPQFDPIGPICQFNTPPALPDTSLNGIAGTWSPDTIDTSVPEPLVFVFTPDASYACAETFEMIILIDTLIIPQFDPIGPLCLNEEPPQLPPANFNEVNGRWEPAVIRTDSVGIFEYVFIPEDGIHCAATDTVFIEILPPVIPEFDPIGPLCIGQIPPQLPETDRNGVTGTWNANTIDTSVAVNLTFVFTPDNTYECAESIAISVTVSENTPPVAWNDSTVTLQNETVMIAVTDNDSDSNSEINVSSVQIIEAPANGTATVSPVTGVIAYTPAPGFVGFDTLSYVVFDDGIPCEPLSDTALVIFEVKAPNNPPVAVNDTFTVMCFPLIEYVLPNDYDPDGDNLQIITWPMVDVQNGTVSIASDGAFVYMPDEGFVGVDTFVYRICDDGFPSMCDEAMVWINVLPSVDCDGLPSEDDEPITECSLFIPDGFSPNSDGVHDFFQIYCIEKYPDAIMRIFDRAGNKLFEKRHYGNLDHWGSDENAWWWGHSEHRMTLGRGTVPSGNYLYVLELGTGEVRTGTVMVAY
ncbi:MAG: gliding motility-associated C-terminal domain-containing protein [Mariniphaga sp.]|nr:gliding motility-associated C-terminal domain-containing protein [Mariniphaga sp.]